MQRATPAVVSPFGVTLVRARPTTDRDASLRASEV